MYQARYVRGLALLLACTGLQSISHHGLLLNYRCCFGQRAPPQCILGGFFVGGFAAATKLPSKLRKLIASFTALESQLAKTLEPLDSSDPAGEDQRAFVAQCQSGGTGPDPREGVSASSLEAAYRRLTRLVSQTNAVDLSSTQPLSEADELEVRANLASHAPWWHYCRPDLYPFSPPGRGASAGHCFLLLGECSKRVGR